MLLHSYDRGGILLAHRLDATPDPFYYVMHAHDGLELYYFIEGDGYFTVEGTNYPLYKGAVLVMREGEAHTLHINPSQKYERITVNLSYSLLDPNNEWENLYDILYNRSLGNDNFFEVGDSSEYIQTLFERLCEASSMNDESSVFEAKSILSAIFSELLSIRRKNPDSRNPEHLPELSLKINNVKKTEAKTVLEIISYINSHLFDIENLSEIETRLYFSRSYINRIFKSATGTSVWNYVLLKRLVAAQNLIKNGTPAAVAATKCGFKDYSSFYKQYKNKLGLSPTSEKTGIMFK